MSTGYAPGTIRVWDGSAWVYQPTDWQEASYEIIKKGATSVAIATTTSCSRSPGTIRKGQNITVTASTSGRNGGNLEFYCRATGGNWFKIATKSAPAGGGSVSVAHSPGQSCFYFAKFTGSSTHKSSNSSSTPVTTVQTLKSATKTVNRGWFQAYNGSGGKISGSGRDNAIHQGYYSGTHGNRKSLIAFDPNLPAGANVTRVIFDCNAAWSAWYANAGGTIVLGSLIDQNAQPNQWPSSKTNENRTRKAVGTGSFSVDISSWANAVVERSDFSGITIGPGPSTSSEYYGYSKNAPDVNDFQLRVSYNYWD